MNFLEGVHKVSSHRGPHAQSLSKQVHSPLRGQCREERLEEVALELYPEVGDGVEVLPADGAQRTCGKAWGLEPIWKEHRH